MKIAALPEDEEFRLQDLYTYDILDTPFEKEYDGLAQLAAQICGCPISLITMVDSDRQWFKAKTGVEEAEMSRDISFCSHTILSEHTMIVENTLADERFADNPLVTGELNIRFYAGAPITSPTGHRLGSVCVADNKPGKLNESQQLALTVIAGQITKLLELRAKNKLLRSRANELLDLKNAALHTAIKEKDNSDRAIAYTLHEEVAQKMAAVKLYMDMTSEEGSFRENYLQQGKQLIAEVLNDVRILSNSILPSNLSRIPIKNLLKDFVIEARKVYRFDIAILTSGEMEDLDFDNSIACLRIVEKWLDILGQRETLGQVVISFRLDGRIYLKITDDSSQMKSREMEECVVKSMIYSRAKLAGGTASYTTTDQFDNVLSVII